MATAKIEYPEAGLIYKKIIDILVDAQAVGKDDVNKDQGFKFRGIDAVVNNINPLLKKHRVAVLPTRVQQINVERFENANKKIVTDAVTVVEYTWIAEDGSTFKTEATGQGRDFADKAVAKSNSVAFRTLLIQSLALPTEAPDPDSESIEIEAAAAPASKPASAQKPVASNDIAGLKNAIKAFVGSPYGADIKAVLNSGTDFLKKQHPSEVKVQADWTDNAGYLAEVLAHFKSGEVA